MYPRHHHLNHFFCLSPIETHISFFVFMITHADKFGKIYEYVTLRTNNVIYYITNDLEVI